MTAHRSVQLWTPLFEPRVTVTMTERDLEALVQILRTGRHDLQELYPDWASHFADRLEGKTP